MITSFGLFLTLLMHPVHETIAEVEWNAETKRLEVALRLSVLDQQWIEHEIDSDKPINKWAINYLGKRFVINESKATKGKPTATYHWIGSEQQGSHVWWYFEIEPADGQRPTEITQRMLFERHEGYVNRVVVLEGKERTAFALTEEHPTIVVP